MKHYLFLLKKHIIARYLDYLKGIAYAELTFIGLFMFSMVIVSGILVFMMGKQIMENPHAMKHFEHLKTYIMIQSIINDNFFTTIGFIAMMLIPISIVKKIYHLRTINNVNIMGYSTLSVFLNFCLGGYVYLNNKHDFSFKYIISLIIIITILDIKKYIKNHGKLIK